MTKLKWETEEYVSIDEKFNRVVIDGSFKIEEIIRLGEYLKQHQWKTQEPTEPGWYWVRIESEFADIGAYLEILDIQFSENCIYYEANFSGYECEPSYDFSEFTHYLGPITPPEMPYIPPRTTG